MKSFRNIKPDESIFNFVKENIQTLNEVYANDYTSDEYLSCLKILELLTNAAIADRQLNNSSLLDEEVVDYEYEEIDENSKDTVT